MNYLSEIYEGTFDSVEQSGMINGMCEENNEYVIRRGMEILGSYGAVSEEPYPSGGAGIIAMGTTIPLNQCDKEELFDLGWFETSYKWPPDSESIEQYGINIIQVKFGQTR